MLPLHCGTVDYSVSYCDPASANRYMLPKDLQVTALFQILLYKPSFPHSASFPKQPPLPTLTLLSLLSCIKTRFRLQISKK